jgi:alkylated DNA nucleotide flippase Atl1
MARRNVDDELLTDVVVEIPKDRERYFGCSGKMLKPSHLSVEALVEKIPRGAVITTAALRKTLAENHDAQTTCPFLTKRALLAIAEDPKTTAPFWRVVTATGEMVTAYPGGANEQARRLRAEGVAIANAAGRLRVSNLR